MPRLGKTYFIVGGIILLVGLLYMTKPRGIRNNNPGNIRKGNTDWVGMSDMQPDPSFISFTSPVYGIRAITKIILAYQTLYGIDTVRGIINRWAPPNENNTDAYVFSVAAGIGVDPDQSLNLREVMPELVTAIIRHENGKQPYSRELIAEGIAKAYA